MATGRKTGGKDFKPGKPGGPGRPKLSEDIKKIRALTDKELAESGKILLTQTKAEIIKILKADNSPVLRVWMASIVANGIKKGDAKNFNQFMDRIVGKVPQKIEASGPDGGPIEIKTQRIKLREILSDPELKDAAIRIGKRLATIDDKS